MVEDTTPEVEEEVEEAPPVVARSLDPEQFTLANYMTQYYLAVGFMPTEDFLVEHGVPKALVRKSFKSKDFLAVLEARGVIIPTGNKLGKLSSVLSPEQLQAANILLDTLDGRSQKKKLQDLGISTQKFEAWKRDPAFQQYLKDRSEATLGDSQWEAHSALVDRVRSGDMKAIQYFNEITGRYVPVLNRGNNNTADLPSILIRVIEVIQKHIDDPAKQEAIANDLLALTVGAAAQLGIAPAPTVIQMPEVVPIRVIQASGDA